jgi:adenosine deaminase
VNTVLLPKVHLHLHLEGAIRPTTLLELYREQGGANAHLTLEQVTQRAQITAQDVTFADFLAKFAFIMPALRQPEHLVRITREALADAAADGVRYVELRFSPHYIQRYSGLHPFAAIEAVIEGLSHGLAEYPDVEATLTLIIDQARGPEAGEEAVAWAARYQGPQTRLNAIDIAGDPSRHPLEAYARACRQARDLGLGITVHAGETQGPASVRTAIEVLGTSRIGHGIRAVEDPEVLALVLERQVTLEVSVSSNVYTGSVPALATHPLPRLLEAGARVTLNTDDPGVFALTLSGEYELLGRTFGLTLADFRRANLVAAEAAFLEPQRRVALCTAIEAGYAAIGGERWT